MCQNLAVLIHKEIPRERVVSAAVNTIMAKSFQEPGYTNVWCVQDETTGLSVAQMPNISQAEAWGRRNETALNAKLTPITRTTQQSVTT